MAFCLNSATLQHYSGY